MAEMTQTGDSFTLAITGALPFVIMVAAIGTPLIALLLLRVYRRAVLKAMSRRSGTTRGGETLAPVNTLQANDSHRPLALNVSDAEALSGLSVPRASWRVVGIYAAAGAVFALIMTLATLISGDIELNLMRLLLVFLVYVWPLFLAVYLDGAATPRTLFFSVCAYVLLMLVLSMVALARSPDLTAAQLIILWTYMNVPAVMLTLAFAARPVRAIGPLVVLFLIVVVTGPVSVLALVGSSDTIMRAVTSVGVSLGFGASATFVAIILVGLLAFSLLGWRVLAWIRRAYVSKRINDKSITVDAVFLLFGVIQSIGLAFEAPLWILSGLVAFLAYKLTLQLGFKLWSTGHGREPRNLRLLLLRVFALGKRSQRLFDAVTRRWRYIGSIQLIAGPDLATTTIDPEELLEFVSGRLGNLFISDEKTLAPRLVALDTRPDFDGRYRVNEFFCHDDSWGMVLPRLVEESHVVLMDLRGFNPQNAGCIYELTELVNVMPLSGVVLVIDDTTDRAFLEQTLKNAWSRLRPDSPNLAMDRAEIQLIRFGRLGPRQLNGLIGSLQAAACVRV